MKNQKEFFLTMTAADTAVAGVCRFKQVGEVNVGAVVERIILTFESVLCPVIDGGLDIRIETSGDYIHFPVRLTGYTGLTVIDLLLPGEQLVMFDSEVDIFFSSYGTAWANAVRLNIFFEKETFTPVEVVQLGSSVGFI